jgi:hypothetical protein
VKNDSTGHHINFHAVVLNPASSKLYLYVADIYAAVLLKRLDEWYKQLEDAKPYKNIYKNIFHHIYISFVSLNITIHYYILYNYYILNNIYY